jgi:hypothetical protein
VSTTDGARLLERLLGDPDFRASFQRDPAAAARNAGFGELADELAADNRKAFETLEIRESRSSVAGVMLAAAVEGLGLFELSEHVMPHLGAEDALAADRPPQAAPADQVAPAAPAGPAPPVDPDDLSEVPPDEPASHDQESDTPASNDQESDGPGSDDDDEDEPDEDEPDEDEPDVEEPDEDDGGDSDDGSDGDDSESDDSGGSDDSHNSDDGDTSDDGDNSDDSDNSDDDDGDDDIDFGPVPDHYPGDSGSQAQISAWMGHEAQKRGLPPELPVMASLVESGMKNLPGGDADSVGFFQMRVSVWNSGDYAGYPERPERQLDWFLDHAAAVKAQRVARGQPIDPQHYGEWIADVERPAAQYRGRYQLQLDDAQHLLRRSFPDGDGVNELIDEGSGSTPRAGPRAREALAEARKYLGTPYQWGGESPNTGFDCSGLVQWAYAKAGIQIPRVTEQQILAPGATKVGRKHLLPGDLVFFRDASGDVHHVGMSLGGDRFIEAPRTGLRVRISSLKEPYYAQQFTGGRRFDAAVPRGNEARVMRAVRPSD